MQLLDNAHLSLQAQRRRQKLGASIYYVYTRVNLPPRNKGGGATIVFCFFLFVCLFVCFNK